jgi:hypothetical protein
MPIFRLDPVEENLDSYHWEASTMSPVTVWVRAENEADARQKLTRATIIATRAVHGRDTPIAPWKDSGHASCALDDKFDPPEGVILTAEGKTLTIEN